MIRIANPTDHGQQKYGSGPGWKFRQVNLGEEISVARATLDSRPQVDLDWLHCHCDPHSTAPMPRRRRPVTQNSKIPRMLLKTALRDGTNARANQSQTTTFQKNLRFIRFFGSRFCCACLLIDCFILEEGSREEGSREKFMSVMHCLLSFCLLG